MEIKFNKPEIIKLNHFIKECYGKDYNVFLIQGLFISYLSSANNTMGIMDIIQNPNSLMEKSWDDETDKEFTRLLFDGLCNQTLKTNEGLKNIIPMVSLECVRSDYIRSYLDLTEIEQRNLLDWYIGYFVGFERFWDYKLIRSFLENSDLKIEDSTVLDFFMNALGAQQATLYNLIKKFKPKYTDPLLKNVVKNITEVIKMKDQGVNKLDDVNAQKYGCSLLSSILLITQEASQSSKELYNNLSTSTIH